MGKSINLNESGVLGKVDGKRLWRSRLISPGVGSSGYYTQELLAEDGPRAIPVGTHVHADHQTFWEREERPEKSVKDIIGVIASEPVYENDGLYANIEIIDEWAPFISQMSEYLGLSIQLKGVLSETEEVDGSPKVEALIPYPTNSVDVVTAAGRDGKFITALESFKEQREETGMKPEDIAAIVEAIKPVISEIVAPLVPKVEEKPEVEEAVKPEEVAEALIEAKLPEISRKRVYSAVEAGSDLKEAIETEAEFIKELSESLSKSEGVLQEKIEDSHDFQIKGWV